jgi:hypothetical protein
MMTARDADPPLERHEAGTPLDYSEDLYTIYVETADTGSAPEQVLRSFLGPRHAKRLHRSAHGFEFVAPIQCVPDIVRLLTLENVAVYQVVRQTKVEGSWR